MNKESTIIKKLVKREPLTFSDKISIWSIVFFMFWMILFILFLDIMISFIIALILVIAIVILIKYRNKFYPSFITVEKIQWMIEDASPTELENIIANMYKQLGYRNVEVTQPTRDSGADVIMKRKKNKYVVQVKKYSKENKVGTEDLQNLQGAKEHYRANCMKIVTTGFYSSVALDYAYRHRIEVIDGDELLNLMYRSYRIRNKFYNKIVRKDKIGVKQ